MNYAVSPSLNFPRSRIHKGKGPYIEGLHMHTQNELQGAAAKRAALRPPRMRGVLTIDSKGQWRTQELYRNIRQRTRANNESICVLAEDGSHLVSHIII